MPRKSNSFKCRQVAKISYDLQATYCYKQGEDRETQPVTQLRINFWFSFF